MTDAYKLLYSTQPNPPLLSHSASTGHKPFAFSSLSLFYSLFNTFSFFFYSFPPGHEVRIVNGALHTYTYTDVCIYIHTAKSSFSVSVYSNVLFFWLFPPCMDMCVSLFYFLSFKWPLCAHLGRKSACLKLGCTSTHECLVVSLWRPSPFNVGVLIYSSEMYERCKGIQQLADWCKTVKQELI